MSTASGQIGIDESGKGDYFGPLVIAGVYVAREQEEPLRAAGVRDSKTLSDKQAAAFAEQIRVLCPFTIVAIGPERYNSLHASFKNLNRLLAWGHARAIENLLEQVPCNHVVADQFGDERFLKNALMAKGRTVTLIQKPRAEEEVAVAAASIIARAEFLRRLQELSTRYGVTLPKGASDVVITAGKEFVRRHGGEALGQVAKLHFRTTASVLGKSSGN
ncbi:MAG TPA: ribonuclease HIII [Candidatus Binatia bacterium]|jgi:ribonuclease HIII|nr:ribonuclease HIII [Candidatus Binatia bacterium]